MKALWCVWCALVMVWASPLAKAEPTLVGDWFFYNKYYAGQEMPEPPTATLRMYFHFSAKGESYLHWHHEGEGDHCARRGEYRIDGEYLVEKTTWVDPENTLSCAEDPDMQLGRVTRTHFYFRGDDLAIRFHLAGDPLDLLWKRVNTEEGK